MTADALQTIGKYQVIDRISTGDLAEIFLARLEGIGGFRRLFAIKRVRPHLVHNQSYAQMIEEEARIAGSLSHGNIVQLLDLGRDEGVLYLVMEYVDGWDLGKVLDAIQRTGVEVPVRHVVFLGIQLLKGLEYAHGRTVMKDGQATALDLVHRDVSPSNILLSRQGDVKLTDFGIARASLKMMETHPDLVARRFDYISPEQARGGTITQAADIWAVALVMYQLLTGVHPFKRQGEFETIEAICDAKHTPLGELREVPELLAEVIGKALSVDPADRPESATAFKEALAEVRHELGGSFSEDTLATWLEGLFSAEPAAEAPAETPSAPVSGATILPVSETADDTGEAEVLSEDHDLPANPDVTSPAKMPAAVEEADEANTVVMGMPAKAAAVAAAAQAKKAEAAQAAAPKATGHDDDAATVVNRDLAARLEDLRNFKVGDEHPDDEATRVRTAALKSLQLEGLAPQATVETSWRAAASASAMGVLVGVLLGAVIMVVLGRYGGMEINPPMLDVRSAPDLQLTVTVDGEPLSGPTELSAGSHRVRVDVVGSQPWEVDLALQAGEYRLMMIEANRMQPEEKR